jgi:ethanolaminephosphotransferase
MAYYSPTFSSPLPPWLYVYAAVALFLYALFDNMDGKQARRTNTSSPLGLLFDHGCDAFNTGLLGALISNIVLQSGGASVTSYLVWVLACATFFLNTWEEYHINKFVLPAVNGPNEGLLIIQLSYLATAYYGPGIWNDKFTLSPLIATLFAPIVAQVRAFSPSTSFPQYITNAEVLVCFMLVASTMNVILNTMNVLFSVDAENEKNVSTKDAKESGTKTKKYQFSPILAALARQLPFWFIVIAGGSWLMFKNTSKVVARHPYIYMFTMGSLFTEATSLLMIAHVSKQEYKPESAVYGTFLFALAPLIYSLYKQKFLPTIFKSVLTSSALEYVLLLCFSYAVSSLIYFAVQAVSEISTELQIDVFSISKQLKNVKKTVASTSSTQVKDSKKSLNQESSESTDSVNAHTSRSPSKATPSSKRSKSTSKRSVTPKRR